MARVRRRDLTESEREKIFELLDSGLTYKEVGEIIGVAVQTVNRYVVARNRGFNSLTDFYNYDAKNKGFKSYRDFCIVSYFNQDDNVFSKGVSLEDKKQNEFEKGMLSIDDSLLDWVEPFDDGLDFSLETREEVRSALSYLAKEYPPLYNVIFDRFYKDRFLGDIGRTKGLSKQSMYNIERKAIEKIRNYFKKREYFGD